MLILSFTPFLEVAFAQQTGKIDVSVQGYDGSSTMTVSLLDATAHYLENKTVNTASFSFTGVVLNQPHTIVLTYKDIPYTTQVNATQDPQQQVNIRVFERATSDENIMISFHHVAISKGDNSINVTEYIEYVNVGDKVQNGTELKVSMPAGFKNFRSSHSCCMTKADFGFFFTIPDPVFPNGTQVLDLEYEISPDSDQYELSKREYYDTGFAVVTVLAGNDFSAVPGSNRTLFSEGPVEIQGQTYDAYSAASVYAGEGFAISLTGYKSATGINIVWVGTGILFALITGAVVYGLRGNKVSDEKLESEAEALNTVMAELEKDYKEGKISEVDYLKLKLKYKSRLEKIESRLQEVAKVKASAKPKAKGKKKEKAETEEIVEEDAAKDEQD
ncbi:MAG: hypothetical protein A3K61_06345 [Thaumarchaeota archaeon RBG_16_49_8]|nr:MAG: hypothetical protein A3K61_06345 [Thaumarchaeota archaeon RBG_16_49_8]